MRESRLPSREERHGYVMCASADALFKALCFPNLHSSMLLGGCRCCCCCARVRAGGRLLGVRRCCLRRGHPKGLERILVGVVGVVGAPRAVVVVVVAQERGPSAPSVACCSRVGSPLLFKGVFASLWLGECVESGCAWRERFRATCWWLLCEKR